MKLNGKRATFYVQSCAAALNGKALTIAGYIIYIPDYFMSVTPAFAAP
jgi:hypothetical protein